MIRCLGGNSPYLGDLAIRELATVRRVVADGPGPVVADALHDLRTLAASQPRAAVAAALRRAKRVIALATAIADIGGIWSLDEVTGALSDLAEAALRAGRAPSLRRCARSGHVRLPDPEDPELGCGLVTRWPWASWARGN